jgi:hypothetical protein
MLIPPYPLKSARAGIRVTSEIPDIQPYRFEGRPKRWRARIKAGKPWHSRQIVTAISFGNRCSNSVYKMRTPTAGYRGGLKIENIMKAKDTSILF